MKVTGIICEYNPLHNGHIYHMKKTRENGASHLVAVMSGNYVQRGDIAVEDKFERAKLAVRSGIDLVLELPCVYSLSSAEFYARGAVHILNSLGCVDELSFGSEVGSVEELSKAAEIIATFRKDSELEELMRGGMSYPNAVNSLIYKKYGSKLGNRVGDILSSPNNVLAVEYIKALKASNSIITPYTIQRKSVAHDSMQVLGNTASASFIRKCMEEGTDFYGLVPDRVYDSYRKSVQKGCRASIKNLERLIIYKLRTATAEELRMIPDVGQGLENRILECAPLRSLDDVLQSIKTKRYTMARIKRILLNLLIGITKSDLEILPPYVRVLASSERGKDVLAMAKTKAKLPVAPALAKLASYGGDAERFARLEAAASDIYALSQDRIGKGQSDYRNMFTIEGASEEDLRKAEELEELGEFFDDEV